MESIQQHLCIAGVCLMTSLEKAAIEMVFRELRKQKVFVNCFFFLVIFVCGVEIKMAFLEKLSCQWLYCLWRIVVINFTRTCSSGALSWKEGRLIGRTRDLHLSFSSSLTSEHRMGQGTQ
ncbi:hypothetical protein GOODEAATRI_021356 [Goodea atripinnis]|uniref:Uncharacterized protein n=1 Tax=Goodea atripinnis TaxID=208336 RepID=A0ABV0MJL1_9TELE